MSDKYRCGAHAPSPDIIWGRDALVACANSGFRELETEHAALLADPHGTNAKIDLLWIGCGRQDPAFPGAERMAGLLAARQIRHTWRPVDGMHNYAFLRDQLEAFLPRLFQRAGADSTEK